MGERNSERKDRPSSDKDRERKHRSGGNSNRPGAQSSSPSGGGSDRQRREDRKNARHGTGSGDRRSDEEKEAKRRARGPGDRSKTSTGAHSSSSTADRARRKEERHSDNRRNEGSRNNREDEPAQTAPIDDGYQVEATAVDDNEADERVRKLEAQMANMMQGGGAPAANIPVAAVNNDDSDSEDEFVGMSCWQRYRCFIMIGFVLLAIGGGVAGYLLGTQQTKEEELAATVAYEKPDEATCKNVKDEVITTNDSVFVDLFFEMIMAQDPPPASTVQIQNSLVALKNGIDNGFIPLLAGCPISQVRRRLVTDDQRYMIADAESQNAILDEDDNVEDAVITVVIPMVVYLKGPESVLTVGELIQNAFNNENGTEALALPSDLVAGVSLTQVAARSSAPTFYVPTQAPAAGPNQAPATDAPVLDAAARRDTIQTLLAETSIQITQTAALDWISDVDTWQPTSGASNASQQWIERYAMVAIYYATNGDSWSNTAGWFGSFSICDGWHGINDCADGLVTELEFGGLGLTGAIPLEVTLLKQLEDINFDRNNLSGSIPTEIGQLTNLLQILLYTNDLSGTIPTEIGNLGNTLEVLQLEENPRLAGTIPTEIGLLTRMWKLELYQTALEGTIPTEIGMATELRFLYFYEVRNIDGTLPTELGNLVNLQEMIGWSSGIEESLPSTAIGKMTSLEVFDVEDCFLTGTIPAEFVDLTNLYHLALDDNEFTGVVPPLPISLQICKMAGNCFLDYTNAPTDCFVQPADCTPWGGVPPGT